MAREGLPDSAFASGNFLLVSRYSRGTLAFLRWECEVIDRAANAIAPLKPKEGLNEAPA